MHKILVINPGSTSTKAAVFENERAVFYESVFHSEKALAPYPTVGDQLMFRYHAVLDLLRAGSQLGGWDAVVGRGGFMRPVASGTYAINSQMLADIADPIRQHASNLGVLIASEIARNHSIPAYVVDPVVVDEMRLIARISGHRDFERRCFFHPLNQKATGRKLAVDLGRDYEDINCIIAHMGGGITVGSHLKGRVVDVNNGLDGEGAFSSERSGTLPVGDVIRMCYSGKYTQDEMLGKVLGKGGMVSYIGTNDIRQAERMAREGYVLADLLLDALAYQVSKEIGAAAAAMDGQVDAIALSGGIVHSKRITEHICTKVGFIAPVHVYPGENEIEAMALAVLRVLRGQEESKVYPGPPIDTLLPDENERIAYCCEVS